MTITETNYITAHFIDNERKNIHVLLKSDDGTSVYPYILEYNPDDPICQEFLKLCSLDQLHENTWLKKKEERKDFEDQVKRIAKKEGLIFDELKLDTKFYPTLVKAIFQGNENEDHLFALKLALFEIEKIRDSKHSELKKKLRQSKTKIDVLKIAFDLL